MIGKIQKVKTVFETKQMHKQTPSPSPTIAKEIKIVVYFLPSWCWRSRLAEEKLQRRPQPNNIFRDFHLQHHSIHWRGTPRSRQIVLDDFLDSPNHVREQ
jgi:hypothetical protein